MVSILVVTSKYYKCKQDFLGLPAFTLKLCGAP